MKNTITEKDLSQNWNFIVYTYLHRKAIIYCIERDIKDIKLKEKMLERAKFHDLDKVYLYTFLPKKEASRIHRLTSRHHMENNIEKTYDDFVEAYLDYESAGFTKDDKPLNAYDTILTYETDPVVKDKLLEICKQIGTDYSYRNPGNPVVRDKWYKYINPFIPVTPEDILNDLSVIFTEREEFLKYVVSPEEDKTYDEFIISLKTKKEKSS